MIYTAIYGLINDERGDIAVKKVYVSLPSVERVQRFVYTLTSLTGDFELITKNHILDARSLMGIFSFDRSRPIQLKVYSDTKRNMDAIRPFLAPTKE